MREAGKGREKVSEKGIAIGRETEQGREGEKTEEWDGGEESD